MVASPLAMPEPAHRVSPRAPWMWVAGALVRVVIAFIALSAMTFGGQWFPIADPVWFGIVVISLLYISVMPWWRYRTHRWETTDAAVYTQTGWLTRERRIAPLSRVQTVDVESGPVSRVLRLATVTVTTASAKGPLKIAGLPRGVADEIVRDLTSRAENMVGDAT